jgi:hypothetical protein
MLPAGWWPEHLRNRKYGAPIFVNYFRGKNFPLRFPWPGGWGSYHLTE